MTPAQQSLHDEIQYFATTWAKLYNPQSEGWSLFNDSDPLQCGIERMDDMSIFDNDADALLVVCRLALVGSPIHAQALAIHYMADELRARVWGPEWVGSRLGPDDRDREIKARTKYLHQFAKEHFEALQGTDIRRQVHAASLVCDSAKRLGELL
jgi:hypothetical protein